MTTRPQSTDVAEAASGSLVGGRRNVGAQRSPLGGGQVGPAEPVLLLHGMGTSHVDFAAVAARLSSSFEVSAVDLPGHGSSPALPGRPTVRAITDALEQHLDETEVARVHVVGNSLGGRIALELAVRGRARSVVAISPSGLGGPVERTVQCAALATAGLGLRTLRTIAPRVTTTAVGRAAVVSGMRAQPWRATQDEADAILHGFGTRPYWSTLLWATAVDAPRHLERITCPVHLIQGCSDLLAGLQTLRYAIAVPDARMSVIAFAGHAAQADRPDRVCAIVRDTIERAREVRALAPGARRRSGAR